MRVFVTGATSFLGSAIVEELLGAGHQVVGLACSEAAIRALQTMGVQVQRGVLDDRDSWRRGVEAVDGVIHTPSSFPGDGQPRQAAVGRTAIQALGAVLAGSERPLVSTATLAGLSTGRLLREADRSHSGETLPPDQSEATADYVAATGVRVSVVRLPPIVHGAGDQGLLARLRQLARRTGRAAYAEPGTNQWTAVHRHDAARLYRLVVEQAPAGGTRFHAVAETGVSVRALAERLGQDLRVPVCALRAGAIAAYFGSLAPVAALDVRATSGYTQQSLSWQPTHPGVLADLDQATYLR